MKREDLIELLNDDNVSYNSVMELRRAFNQELSRDVAVSDRRNAISRGIEAVKGILQRYHEMGIVVGDMDPGHGVGHLARDYINALLLSQQEAIDPQHIFVGFVGGVLHDCGNTIINRYDEEKRVIRHGEAGSLLFNAVARDVDINDAERILIANAIAAHTHYLKPLVITGRDGLIRTLEPYQDLDSDGRPILGIWLVRWIDRLDCNGPTFPGRHYLTLTSPRPEFDGVAFYQSDLKSALNPTLRTELEIKSPNAHPQTMREHLRMFARSATNNSPYGTHDLPVMQAMRNENTSALNSIIGAVDPDANLTASDIDAGLANWTAFMSNIEPSQLGRNAAVKLQDMFGGLPETTRRAWVSGFDQAMRVYPLWAARKIEALKSLKLKSDDYALPLLDQDVREVLEPRFTL